MLPFESLASKNKRSLTGALDLGGILMSASIKEQLLASDEEFRRLAQEHTTYSKRLEALIEKRYLSDDEKLEEVRLKKLKLRLKDQMEAIEQKHRLQVGAENQVA